MAGLLVNNVPPVEGVVVTQLQKAVLQRFCCGARQPHTQYLHRLGAVARWWVGHCVDVILEETIE